MGADTKKAGDPTISCRTNVDSTKSEDRNGERRRHVRRTNDADVPLEMGGAWKETYPNSCQTKRSSSRRAPSPFKTTASTGENGSRTYAAITSDERRGGTASKGICAESGSSRRSDHGRCSSNGPSTADGTRSASLYNSGRDHLRLKPAQ